MLRAGPPMLVAGPPLAAASQPIPVPVNPLTATAPDRPPRLGTPRRSSADAGLLPDGHSLVETVDLAPWHGARQGRLGRQPTWRRLLLTPPLAPAARGGLLVRRRCRGRRAFP